MEGYDANGFLEMFKPLYAVDTLQGYTDEDYKELMTVLEGIGEPV